MDHPCTGLLGNRFLWQHHLQLDPEMGKGDVLVLCGSIRFLSNIPLIWAAWRRGVGVVWWGHGFSKRRNRVKDMINRVIVRFVAARLLYTDQELEEYKKLGCPSDKLFATNNAIDEIPIQEAIATWQGRRLDDFQEREGLSGHHTLLFCGRRTNSVDLEIVLASMARLKRFGKMTRFVIIGPRDENGALMKRANELGVSEDVRQLGAMFDQQEMAPWFLSASCLVFPGPIGLSLIHAFFYGLPAIVADCKHGPEIAALHHGQNGFFYKDGDEVDLATKLLAIIDDPECRRRLSTNALRTVKEDYSMESMVRRFVSTIEAASRRMLGRS